MTSETGFCIILFMDTTTPTVSTLTSALATIEPAVYTDMAASGKWSRMPDPSSPWQLSSRVEEMGNGRVRVLFFCDHSTKFVNAYKTRVGNRLVAQFPQASFVHAKRNGYKIWNTYLSDGSHDGWAAGLELVPATSDAVAP